MRANFDRRSICIAGLGFDSSSPVFQTRAISGGKQKNRIGRIFHCFKALTKLFDSRRLCAAAAAEARPGPTVFALKAVCDFADSAKNDDYQAYAAYTSARAVQAFFERHMADCRDLAGT